MTRARRHSANRIARNSDFVLVLGNGTTHTKADLLDQARSRSIAWERQDEAGWRYVFGQASLALPTTP